MGAEQSINYAVNTCMCNCDVRKDAVNVKQQGKAGSSASRAGFPGFDRNGKLVSTAVTDKGQESRSFEETNYSKVYFFTVVFCVHPCIQTRNKAHFRLRSCTQGFHKVITKVALISLPIPFMATLQSIRQHK